MGVKWRLSGGVHQSSTEVLKLAKRGFDISRKTGAVQLLGSKMLPTAQLSARGAGLRALT